MTKSEKAIERASKQARELEKKYNAPVVWMGKNKFIVVKDGKEIAVEVQNTVKTMVYWQNEEED